MDNGSCIAIKSQVLTGIAMGCRRDKHMVLLSQLARNALLHKMGTLKTF